MKRAKIIPTQHLGIPPSLTKQLCIVLLSPWTHLSLPLWRLKDPLSVCTYIMSFKVTFRQRGPVTCWVHLLELLTLSPAVTQARSPGHTYSLHLETRGFPIYTDCVCEGFLKSASTGHLTPSSTCVSIKNSAALCVQRYTLKIEMHGSRVFSINKHKFLFFSPAGHIHLDF